MTSKQDGCYYFECVQYPKMYQMFLLGTSWMFGHANQLPALPPNLFQVEDHMHVRARAYTRARTHKLTSASWLFGDVSLKLQVHNRLWSDLSRVSLTHMSFECLYFRACSKAASQWGSSLISTRIHAITSQKTVFLIVTIVRSSSPTHALLESITCKKVKNIKHIPVNGHDLTTYCLYLSYDTVWLLTDAADVQPFRLTLHLFSSCKNNRQHLSQF